LGREEGCRRTYYDVLGVPAGVDAEAIHNAYRARARQYHPDAGEGSSAGKFREIVEAYETLGDPERRQAYDRMVARERASAPRAEVVVEPLAQPWFSSPTQTMNAWLTAMHFRCASVMDEWFEEVFRSFEEFFGR
jgi:DnaJ-class molecular chaperone